MLNSAQVNNWTDLLKLISNTAADNKLCAVIIESNSCRYLCALEINSIKNVNLLLFIVF